MQLSPFLGDSPNTSRFRFAKLGASNARLVGKNPDMPRAGIVGMRGSMAIRLQPCVIASTLNPHPSPPSSLPRGIVAQSGEHTSRGVDLHLAALQPSRLLPPLRRHQCRRPRSRRHRNTPPMPPIPRCRLRHPSFFFFSGGGGEVKTGKPPRGLVVQKGRRSRAERGRAGQTNRAEQEKAKQGG